jgi:hypothetical protein
MVDANKERQQEEVDNGTYKQEVAPLHFPEVFRMNDESTRMDFLQLILDV